MSESSFIATKNPSSSTLKIIGPDGSSNTLDSKISQIDVLEMLLRNLIENVCGLHGLIYQLAHGNNIDQIEITQEYLQSEAVLSALHQEELFSNHTYRFFFSNLAALCALVGVPNPEISIEKIAVLRTKSKQLKFQWSGVSVEEPLNFKIQI
jgi:hypothetical protein